MTFENVLAEDKKTHQESGVDLSAAKLQLEGRGSAAETTRSEAPGMCNLPISCCSVLALAFQGESWNNEVASNPRSDTKGKKEEETKKKNGATDVAGRLGDSFFPARRCRPPPDHHLPSQQGGGGGLLASAILVPLAPRRYLCGGKLGCSVLPTNVSVGPF